MNFIVHLIRKTLQKQKSTRWKISFSLNCESATPNAKSKTSISKIKKGLERSTWIKNKAIMKETFKN